MAGKLIPSGRFREPVKLVEPDGTEHQARARYRSRVPVALGQDGAVTEQLGVGEYTVKRSPAIADISTQWHVEAFGNLETIESIDSGRYDPRLYLVIRTNQQTKQVDD